jgi:hypothetical protein
MHRLLRLNRGGEFPATRDIADEKGHLQARGQEPPGSAL